MFCPKCGRELPNEAKFCDVCGEHIIKKNMDISTTISELSGKLNLNKKKVMIGGIVLAAILVVILIINAAGKISGKTDARGSGNKGFKSYEDAVDAYLTAAFDKDVETVVNCFPADIRQNIVQIYNSYRSGTYSKETSMFEFMAENLDTEFSYEIDNTVELTKDEINELESAYELKIAKGYAVDVTVAGKYYCPIPIYESDGFKGWQDGYTTTSPKGTIKVVKIGKSWYIAGALNDYFWGRFYMSIIPWKEY